MNSTYAQKSSTVQKAADTKAASVLDASSQSESLQRKADMVNNVAQRAETPRPNNTGMPDNLKSGIESLSGFSMDDVRVHYNSSKPATVQALAYTQGTDIHVAPGQEKHLPHEAWHVAQQMAGRVSPTTNINGMPVNDNAALEHEADVMGEKACTQRISKTSFLNTFYPPFNYSIQRVENKFNDGNRDQTDPGGNDPGFEIPQNNPALARHHVIPLNCINKFLDTIDDVYNKSKKDPDIKDPDQTPLYPLLFDLEDLHGDDIFEYFSNIENALNLACKWKYEALNSSAGKKLEELRLNKEGKNEITPKEASIKERLKLSNDEYEALKRATNWMPANIFLGPKNRSDDNGDVFDKGFSSAVDDQNQPVSESTFHLFQTTYDIMENAIREQFSYDISRASIKLMDIVKLRDSFWKYNPDNWEVDGNNKYKAKSTK